jgi:DNA-binding transcriptional ArsR family regulator
VSERIQYLLNTSLIKKYNQSGMALREELNKILRIVAELSLNDVETSVGDNSIYKESGLPPNKVQMHLSELESLGLVREILSPESTRPPERDYRLYNLTQKGLDSLSSTA